MQHVVTSLLGLKKIPRPDDAADALAVALCHAHTSRFGKLFGTRYFFGLVLLQNFVYAIFEHGKPHGKALFLGCEHHRLYEYTPNQIKQSLTGYGKADKIQMQHVVTSLKAYSRCCFD